MLFDAHAHVNTADVDRYPVDPVDGHLPSTALSHALTGEALVAAMDANGVDRAVVVQRCHVYGFDNRYTLDMAAAFPDRLKALCVIDGRAADAVRQADHCLDRGAVGIRYMEPVRDQGLDWLAGEHARAAWRRTVERGGTMRVHLFPWNRAAGLAAVLDQIAAVPETRIVIDHLTNFDPARGPLGGDGGMERLADHPGAALLFSTINLRRWADAGHDAAAELGRAVALFGAERVMWGSDTGNSLAAYPDVIADARTAAAGLSERDRASLFHGAAAAFYG